MRFDQASYTRLELANGLGASPSGAAFATNTGDMLEISCYGVGLFRLRVGANTRADYGLLQARTQRCEVSASEAATWSFTAGDSRLEVDAAPFALRLYSSDQLRLQSVTDRAADGNPRLPALARTRAGDSWIAAFALASGAPMYGFGARQGALDARGSTLVTEADSSAADGDAGAAFGWSASAGAAWGLYTHTPARTTHCVGDAAWSHRSYAVQVEDEALDLFLIAGRDPAQVIERYSHLTGRSPGVPAWCLGLWLADPSSPHIDENLRLGATFRERGIPADVVVLDGRALWNTRTRYDFQFDPTRYPDPAGSIGRLRTQGFRICVAEYPSVSVYSPLFRDLVTHGYLLVRTNGEPQIFAWNPPAANRANPITPPESGLIDFTNEEACAWWRDAHQTIFSLGVDTLWLQGVPDLPSDCVAANGDHGARLRNVYPMLYARCSHDAMHKFQSSDDSGSTLPTLWHRAGWSGGQRLPVQGDGEVQRDWEGLAAAIRTALSAGMTGIAHHGCEIGGSYGATALAPELFVRWLQMSVFASHLRLSCSTGSEPWAFGAEIEAAARHWMEFRYRLLPYLQSVVAQAARTGLPVMRAMPLAFPGNALTRHYETQFMCGDALLVAPIIAPGGEAEIALPPGAWYDLASRQRLPGRQVIRYRAPIDRFPVFGREGYVLPLGPAAQSTGELDPDRPLDTVYVFGKPVRAWQEFAQAKLALEPEPRLLHAPGIGVEVFGDAGAVKIEPLT